MCRLMIYVTLLSLILVGCGHFPEANIKSAKFADPNGQFVDVNRVEIYLQTWGTDHLILGSVFK